MQDADPLLRAARKPFPASSAMAYSVFFLEKTNDALFHPGGKLPAWTAGNSSMAILSRAAHAPNESSRTSDMEKIVLIISSPCKPWRDPVYILETAFAQAPPELL